MSYSFYEVYITAQRAFTSMGFPYGSDEDAAFIIAWLELNKFRGVNILANLINELDKKYEGRIRLKDLNGKINFENKSILMKGIGLIDFISAEINQKNIISLEISNCKDGILFLPLLYKKLKNVSFSKLTFCNTKNEINTFIIINNEIIFNRKKNKNLLEYNVVRIDVNTNKNNTKKLNKNIIISEKEILNNLSKSLTPDLCAWNKVSNIANKTFVPESDESRKKGAGGGNDND